MPQAYLRTAEALMLEPTQVCLVAAHNDDLQAARACGLRTAFAARPYEHGADYAKRQTKDVKATSDWDVVANSIEEVADAVGA